MYPLYVYDHPKKGVSKISKSVQKGFNTYYVPRRVSLKYNQYVIDVIRGEINSGISLFNISSFNIPHKRSASLPFLLVG